MIYFYILYSTTFYSGLYEYWFVQCYTIKLVNLAIHYVYIEHNICLSNADGWKMSKYEISQFTENTNISAWLDLPCF